MKDEIFVMLFCRSVIQSAFMQKAQSFPTIILRNVHPIGMQQMRVGEWT
jgi:hypothetical protein